ncbi:MAG: ABC transporter substrate-binding protein [Deltaproteobacteria bacterium]
MRGRRLVSVVIVVGIVLCSLTIEPVSAGDKKAIRFGALPVLQALPLYVARDKGFWRDAGLNVEIVPFNTAADKDIALSAGSIEGCFADLVTPLVLKGNGRDIVIVATNYETRQDRRMFGILGKPGSTFQSIADLADVPVAISSNSVIDYVTERLLRSGGVPADRVASIESKNIGLRFLMLLSGQVEAATLPEPLVSAALMKGAVLLGDDSGLATSQTVLVFSGPFTRDHPKAVTAFLRGVEEANAFINSQADMVRSVMAEYVRLPAALRDTYPIPRFPELHAPDRDALLTVAEWLRKRGVIRPQLTYEEVVNAGFIP